MTTPMTREQAAAHLVTFVAMGAPPTRLALACRMGADALKDARRLASRNAAAESDLADALANVDQLRILLSGVLASTACTDDHDVAICPSITAAVHLEQDVRPHG